MKKFFVALTVFMTFFGSAGAGARPLLDDDKPTGLETATFGLGCYWTIDSFLGSLPGVIYTRAGSSDGAEAVQVDFDPKVITYQELLNVFWTAHHPDITIDDRMYQNAVFYHTEQQRVAAEASKAAMAKKLSKPITSTIEPVNFKAARDSEQKYFLRNSPIWEDFKKNYPDGDVMNSAAAAKINGYLGGNSEQKYFDAYAPKLGLSEASLAQLRKKVPEKATAYTPKCTMQVSK